MVAIGNKYGILNVNGIANVKFWTRTNFVDIDPKLSKDIPPLRVKITPYSIYTCTLSRIATKNK